MKSVAHGKGGKTLMGMLESWLTGNDKISLWNVVSITHKLFGCVRSNTNSKNNRSSVMLFVPLKLHSKKRKELNLFDQGAPYCGLKISATF